MTGDVFKTYPMCEGQSYLEDALPSLFPVPKEQPLGQSLNKVLGGAGHRVELVPLFQPGENVTVAWQCLTSDDEGRCYQGVHVSCLADVIAHGQTLGSNLRSEAVGGGWSDGSIGV